MGFEYLTNIPLEKAREEYIQLLLDAGFGAKTEVIPVEQSCGRITAKAVYAAICAPHYPASAMDGITLSGGDPFMQPVECTELAKGAHRCGLNVWTYTGYTWEALFEENDPDKIALVKESDILIDGPFILAERSLELKFRGSRNQRIIDVKKSIEAGEIILWEDYTFDLPEGPQSFGRL